MQKFFVSFDGTKICYDYTLGSGDKSRLILLHGFGGDLTAWNEEVKILNSKGHSTLAIDLRGHGLSDRPNSKDSYISECFVKDVVGIINFEKIKKPVLIGHCFGGMYSIVLAGSYPNFFRGLILIDTNYQAPTIFFFQKYRLIFSILGYICRLLPQKHYSQHINFQPFKNTSDYNLRRLANDVNHVSPSIYLMICDMLTSFNAFSFLSKIKIPTLIIEGTKDTIFPPVVAQKLQQNITNSQLHYIKNANHILILSHPREIAEEIATFSEELQK